MKIMRGVYHEILGCMYWWNYEYEVLNWLKSTKNVWVSFWWTKLNHSWTQVSDKKVRKKIEESDEEMTTKKIKKQAAVKTPSKTPSKAKKKGKYWLIENSLFSFMNKYIYSFTENGSCNINCRRRSLLQTLFVWILGT